MVVGDRKLSLPVSAALDPSGHERSGSFCDGTCMYYVPTSLIDCSPGALELDNVT